MKEIRDEELLSSSLDNSIFLQLLKTSGQIIISFDACGNILETSPAEQNFLEYPPAELKGMNLGQLIYPETDFENLKSKFTKENLWKEIQWLTRSGKLQLYRCAFSFSQGGGHCLLTPASDTARLKKELEHNMVLLNHTHSLNSLGTWECNLQTEEMYWSDSLYALYGLDKKKHPKPCQELLYNIVPEEDLEDTRANIRQLFEKDYYRFIHRIRLANGSYRYIYQLGRAVKDSQGNYTHAHGTAQDITEQKESELLLQASERKLKTLVAHSHDMIGIIDSVGNYSWVSDNVERILGYKAEELVKMNAIDLIHPEDADHIVSRLSEIIFQKEITLEAFRFKTKSGDYRWINSHISNLMDDPEINGLVVNSSDITSKKFYQDQIRALSIIAEEAPHCIVLTNADLKVIWVNKIFQQRTGYSIEEIFGKPFLDLYTKKGNEAALEEMRRHLSESKPYETVICNENRWGKKFWVQTSIQPVYNEKGEVIQYFGMSVDITERLRLENQLKNETERRQKRITAAVIQGQEKEREGISRELHDNVNQILATAKLYIELQRHDKREELQDQAETLLNRAINEIRKISKALAPPPLNEIDLVDSIEELLNSLRTAGKVRIVFKTHGLQNAALTHNVQVVVYRLIQESLTNIMRHSQATKVSVSLSVLSKKLTLIIKDNGIGFNTEKRRSGIGISNMINRVESLNGRLEIQSREGMGSTLVASIPLVHVME